MQLTTRIHRNIYIWFTLTDFLLSLVEVVVLYDSSFCKPFAFKEFYNKQCSVHEKLLHKTAMRTVDCDMGFLDEVVKH